MRLLSILLIWAVSFSLAACEDKVRTARELWTRGEHQHAIAKLSEVTIKNPDAREAKHLFEEYLYQYGIETAKNYWEEGKYGETIAKLKELSSKYPSKEDLKQLLSDYKIETPRMLWAEGKQEEALARLREELATNPSNEAAKELFLNYNGSSITGFVMDLYLRNRAGENIMVVATTESDTASEQNRVRLDATTNTNAEFTIKNAIPGKIYQIEVMMQGVKSTSASVTSAPRGEVALLKEPLRIVKLPYTGSAGRGVYIVNEYSYRYTSLPNAFFPHGENRAPEGDWSASSIPIYTGNNFIKIGGDVAARFDPVSGICDEWNMSDRNSIDNQAESVHTREGEVSVIRTIGALPSGVWSFQVSSYGNRFLFRVPPNDLSSVINSGNADAVASIIRSGIDVNQAGNDGKTALMTAAEKGNINIIIELAASGADLNAKDATGKTAADYANENGMSNATMVINGIQTGVNPRGALIAAYNKCLEALKNHDYNKLYSMLCNRVKSYTSLEDFKEILNEKWDRLVKHLITTRGVIEVAVNSNECILYVMTDENRMRSAPLRFVKEEGSWLIYDTYGFVPYFSMESLLNLSASKGNSVKLEKILSSASSHGEDRQKVIDCALCKAISNGHTESARILLENGANINTYEDNTGMSLLLIACEKGYIDITKLLLTKGSDVNIRGNGLTPLLLASVSGKTELVKLLIEAGADVNAKIEKDRRVPFSVQNEGATSLMLAEKHGHKKVVDILRSVGAT